MKHLAVLLIIAACGKANDLPALKTEALGIVQSYQARFTDLTDRAKAIMQRGTSITVTNAEIMNVSQFFGRSVNRIEQCDPNTKVCSGIKYELENAPNEIAAIKEPALLRAYIDKKARQWRDAYTEINADLDAVESWITIAESRPQQVAKREERPVVPPDVDATPPVPEVDVPPPPPAGTRGAGGTVPPTQ